MKSLKNILRRILTLTVALAMLITALPISGIGVWAATNGSVTGLSDSSIELSFSGNANDAWSATGTQIVGSTISTGGCSTTNYYSTLTITNTKGIPATLSFDYALVANSGSFQVDGTTVTENGSFSKELPSGKSVTVYLKSGSTSAATTITLTKVSLIADVNAITTFVPAENGSYTVDGASITEEYQKEQSSTIAYNVVATPADGYKFFGWYDITNDKIIDSNPSTGLNIESNCKITAVFVEKALAVFETAGNRFVDLGDAVACAQRKNATKITQIEDGEIRGNYTIPSGITLLIPFDEAGTVYTSSPGNSGTATSSQKAFRTLTMTAGSSIIVDGAISIGAKHNAAAGGGKMSVSGAYGYIKMAEGSQITVNSKGSLYTWGFISGKGNVVAKSGSTVYEYFQIVDFRGGTMTSNLSSTEVFPLSQYYVQNVEVPLTMEAGANEIVYASLYAGGMTVSTAVDFIGSKGLFNVTSGSFTKVYNSSIDRMMYTVNGDMELNSLQLTVAMANVNSKNYVLPINSNITMNVASGTTTVNQDIYLAPGVEVNISEGANLTISNGYNAYVYDKSEWGNYVMSSQFIPVVYSPTKSYNRTVNDLVDAKININGSLTANGYVYTTESGANICSNGSGQFIMNGGSGTATVTKQCVNNTGSPIDINIIPAKLRNDVKYAGTEDEYTLTVGSKAGTIITYNNQTGKWESDECKHANSEIRNAKEATCTENGYTGDTYCVECGEKIVEGAVITAQGHNYTETIMKEATCTETGEKHLKCTRCDDEKTEVIPTISHVEVIDPGTEPTCTESGLSEGKHCSLCGTVTVAQEVVSALGHDWDYGEISQAPTCNEAGLKTFICKRCNETKTEVVDATGHTVVVDAAVTPTCTETGLTEGAHCSVCDSIITEQVIIDALGHMYDEGIVTKEATCTNVGIMTFTCTRCGQSYTNEIAAVGHTEVIDSAIAATCTESGLTEGKHCSVCNEILVAQVIIDALGHMYDEGTVTKEATCTEAGIKTFTCTRCKDSYEEEITATGHTVVVDEAMAATCIEAGLTEGKHCSVCGAVLAAQENVPALGHDYVDHICTRCGDVQLHGWVTEEKGLTYYVDGEKVYFDTWATIDDNGYFFDPEGYIVKGLCTITDSEGNTSTYVFNSETGVFEKNMNGVKVFAERPYIVTYGIAVEASFGWNTFKGEQYYIDSETEAFVSGGIYWLPYPEGYGPDQWNLENNDDYAALGYETQSYFIFDNNGIFQKSTNGMYTVNAGTTIVGGNAAKADAGFVTWAINGELPYHVGLVKDGEDYYYFTTGGFEQGKTFVAGKDYSISKTNDLAIPEQWGEGTFVVGKYTFDEEGKLCIFDGFVDKDGETFCYVKGVKTYAGLIQIKDDFYYINSSCKVIKGRSYAVSKTNGLLPAGTYTFDSDGKMIREDATLNGIVKESDTKWYYYVNGVKNYAGLILIDGDYYYVNSNYEVVHGRNYFISKTNGLKPNATYEFDADGKMVLGNENLNGIVKESDEKWFYYVNGIKTYAGLIQIDGNYYYVNSSFNVIHGKKYFISKSNGLMPNGTYEFDADGIMIVK